MTNRLDKPRPGPQPIPEPIPADDDWEEPLVPRPGPRGTGRDSVDNIVAALEP